MIRTLTASVVAALTVALLPGPPAAAAGLPLGDHDLAETRTTQRLTDGVTLTRIVRGAEPAPADQINTTTRGPWVVNVLTIDPRRAHGHLSATYGPDLAGVEKTSALGTHAVAAVNASFFTFTASPQYPGDPVGLGLYDGELLSEPTTDPAEVNLVVDGTRNRVTMGRLTWSGRVGRVPLEFINHPPVVPAACATLPDQTQCASPGDIVRFTPSFSAATPSGPGAEVVFNRSGCVTRTLTTRGTALRAGETSVQATGSDTVAVLALRGCPKQKITLTDQNGRRVPLRPGMFGVNGRYRLTAGGRVVVPAGEGSFFARNPRSIAGTTADGRIVLATIDGRMTTSVGTTMDETAAVAHALGLTDAINLDGGGSTAMAVRGALVNTPSGGAERAVGDALIFRNR